MDAGDENHSGTGGRGLKKQTDGQRGRVGDQGKGGFLARRERSKARDSRIDLEKKTDSADHWTAGATELFFKREAS